MSYDLPCETVRDLIPLYLDRVLAKKSSESVKNHLKHCSVCRDYVNVGSFQIKHNKNEKTFGADYKTLTKKIKKRRFIRDVIAFVASLIAVGSVAALIIGFEEKADKKR